MSQLSETWPSGEEQLRILGVIKRQYPMPRKFPKPHESYDHWRVEEWFPREKACYFRLEYGRHCSESDITCDWFSWKWVASRRAWIRIDRATLETTTITQKEFDSIRRE